MTKSVLLWLLSLIAVAVVTASITTAQAPQISPAGGVRLLK